MTSNLSFETEIDPEAAGYPLVFFEGTKNSPGAFYYEKTPEFWYPLVRRKQPPIPAEELPPCDPGSGNKSKL